jgi:hypothetical protein
MVTLASSDELTRNWEIVPQGWNMIVPFASRLF